MQLSRLLAHNKESSASTEKPAAEKPVENLNLFKKETGTIINAPIEVKNGPTIQEKKANAGQCPAGQAKDWAGICFPLKECKASISAQPGTCQSEEERTSGMMTAEKLELKKPATSSNPQPENCFKTETRSGKSLCLTTNKEPEKPVPEHPFVPCKGPAGTHNGIGAAFCWQKGSERKVRAF